MLEINKRRGKVEINEKEIMKTAASQLRSLAEEVSVYRETDERRKLAEDIVSKTDIDLSPGEVIDKVAELANKSMHDLIVLEKAIELQKTGEFRLGSISQQVADNGDLDPLTAHLIEGYQ